MVAGLDALLARHSAVDEGEAEWPGGVRLRIRGYLTAETRRSRA